MDERAVLEAFYTATNGDTWTSQTDGDSSNDWPNKGVNPYTIPDTTTCLNDLYGVYVSANTGRVTNIDLPNNNLSGTIPDLSALTGLGLLKLRENRLTGPIPTKLTDPNDQNSRAIALPASLTHLELDTNELTGTIPGPLPTGLVSLWLNDNDLSGTIPRPLPASLTHLYLHNNDLSGTIPPLSAVTGLRDLRLYNNELSGQIPALSALTSLRILLLHNNELSGQIPALSALTSLEYLYLHNNKLTGQIPALPASLINLYLHNNKLSGALPTTLGSLNSLALLGLVKNAGLYGYPSGMDAKHNLHLLALGNGTAGCLPTTSGGTDCTIPTDVDRLRLDLSPTQITATWQPHPASSSPGGYEVAYQLSTAPSWTSVPLTPVTATTATITGLTTGKRYNVRVRTTDSPTTTATDRTPWLWSQVVLPVLAAPTGLRVTPGDTELALSWTAPSGTVTGYDVHHKTTTAADQPAAPPTDPTTGWVDANVTLTGTTATLTGLTNDTPYDVRVRAKNTAGNGVWAASTGTPVASPNLSGLSGRTSTDGLTFSGTLTLSPAFAADTKDYRATVPSATTHVKLTPTFSASAWVGVAKVSSFSRPEQFELKSVASGSPSDAIALAVGQNFLRVVVHVPSTTEQRTYRVTITRQGGTTDDGTTDDGGTNTGGTGGGGTPADQHGNAPDAATSLNPRGYTTGVIQLTLTAHLQSRRDVDYFTLTLPYAGVLTAWTTGTDTTGRLYQAQEEGSPTLVAEDTDSGRGTNFRLSTAVAAATYYLAVSAGRGSGEYTLSVHYTPAFAENPGPDSPQSGVSVLSGWVCDAERVEIELVPASGAPQTWVPATGTSRLDTAVACGPTTTDTGYGLLYNWNLLGDGEHTVRVWIDDVLLAERAITVTTLGPHEDQEFRRDLTATTEVADFPAVGETTTLRWEQARQNFMIARGAGGGTGQQLTPAQAILGNPAPGSFQSGIGVLSGWVCEAETVELVFETATGTTFTEEAGYGTERADTAGVCGDTDNGFGLLFNWNRLGEGLHTVRAYADGEAFAHSTFNVTTLGAHVDEEFRRGLQKTHAIEDFPAEGQTTTVEWQQGQQNFVITGVASGE